MIFFFGMVIQDALQSNLKVYFVANFASYWLVYVLSL